MSELTRTQGSDDTFAGLDYDNSGLALADICRSIAEVVRVGPDKPRRVRVALGAASVEVEWEGDRGPAALVGPAPQEGTGAAGAPESRSWRGTASVPLSSVPSTPLPPPARRPSYSRAIMWRRGSSSASSRR